MLTDREYKKLKARNERNIEWSKQFAKPNGWIVISKEEQATCPKNARITNEERSQLEVYEFYHNPPARYFLYVDVPNKIATTWTGDKLGNIRFGAEFRSSFGDRRVPISMHAINGRNYHGTYYKSAGDYARIKLSKAS